MSIFSFDNVILYCGSYDATFGCLPVLFISNEMMTKYHLRHMSYYHLQYMSHNNQHRFFTPCLILPDPSLFHTEIAMNEPYYTYFNINRYTSYSLHSFYTHGDHLSLENTLLKKQNNSESKYIYPEHLTLSLYDNNIHDIQNNMSYVSILRSQYGHIPMYIKSTLLLTFGNKIYPLYINNATVNNNTYIPDGLPFTIPVHIKRQFTQLAIIPHHHETSPSIEYKSDINIHKNIYDPVITSFNIKTMKSLLQGNISTIYTSLLFNIHSFFTNMQQYIPLSSSLVQSPLSLSSSLSESSPSSPSSSSPFSSSILMLGGSAGLGKYHISHTISLYYTQYSHKYISVYKLQPIQYISLDCMDIYHALPSSSQRFDADLDITKMFIHLNDITKSQRNTYTIITTLFQKWTDIIVSSLPCIVSFSHLNSLLTTGEENDRSDIDGSSSIKTETQDNIDKNDKNDPSSQYTFRLRVFILFIYSITQQLPYILHKQHLNTIKPINNRVLFLLPSTNPHIFKNCYTSITSSISLPSSQSSHTSTDGNNNNIQSSSPSFVQPPPTTFKILNISNIAPLERFTILISLLSRLLSSTLAPLPSSSLTVPNFPLVLPPSSSLSSNASDLFRASASYFDTFPLLSYQCLPMSKDEKVLRKLFSLYYTQPIIADTITQSTSLKVLCGTLSHIDASTTTYAPAAPTISTTHYTRRISLLSILQKHKSLFTSSVLDYINLICDDITIHNDILSHDNNIDIKHIRPSIMMSLSSPSSPASPQGNNAPSAQGGNTPSQSSDTLDTQSSVKTTPLPPSWALYLTMMDPSSPLPALSPQPFSSLTSNTALPCVLSLSSPENNTSSTKALYEPLFSSPFFYTIFQLVRIPYLLTLVQYIIEHTAGYTPSSVLVLLQQIVPLLQKDLFYSDKQSPSSSSPQTSSSQTAISPLPTPQNIYISQQCLTTIVSRIHHFTSTSHHIPTYSNTPSSSSSSTSLSWSSIIGHESALSTIKPILAQWLSPSLSTRLGILPPRGILLCGPPGCGKSMISSIISSHVNMTVLTLSCSSILQRYLGESERTVKDLFHTAQRLSPSLIILEDIEAIAPNRAHIGDGSANGSDSGTGVELRVLSTLLNCLEGIGNIRSNGVYIIGTCYNLSMIDSALSRPGRFDTIIQLHLPSYYNICDIILSQCYHLCILESSSSSSMSTSTSRPSALPQLSSSLQPTTLGQNQSSQITPRTQWSELYSGHITLPQEPSSFIPKATYISQIHTELCNNNSMIDIYTIVYIISPLCHLEKLSQGSILSLCHHAIMYSIDDYSDNNTILPPSQSQSSMPLSSETVISSASSPSSSAATLSNDILQHQGIVLKKKHFYQALQYLIK